MQSKNLPKLTLIIMDKKCNTKIDMNKNNKVKNVLKLVGVGVVSGLINGFFGAGGGLLLVSLISTVNKNDSKTAHATTLVCVMFMCVASSVTYFLKKQINFKLIIVCGIGSLVGSLIGTKMLKKLKNNIIDLVFSCVLILAGVCMIVF